MIDYCSKHNADKMRSQRTCHEEELFGLISRRFEGDNIWNLCCVEVWWSLWVGEAEREDCWDRYCLVPELTCELVLTWEIHQASSLSLLLVQVHLLYRQRPTEKLDCAEILLTPRLSRQHLPLLQSRKRWKGNLRHHNFFKHFCYYKQHNTNQSLLLNGID